MDRREDLAEPTLAFAFAELEIFETKRVFLAFVFAVFLLEEKEAGGALCAGTRGQNVILARCFLSIPGLGRGQFFPSLVGCDFGSD